jgi:hypothetical protein
VHRRGSKGLRSEPHRRRPAQSTFPRLTQLDLWISGPQCIRMVHPEMASLLPARGFFLILTCSDLLVAPTYESIAPAAAAPRRQRGASWSSRRLARPTGARRFGRDDGTARSRLHVCSCQV